MATTNPKLIIRATAMPGTNPTPPGRAHTPMINSSDTARKVKATQPNPSSGPPSDCRARARMAFDVQVVLVIAAFLLVSTWVLTVSSTCHRRGTLPRPVSRLGLVLGVSYPVGLVIAAAGLLFPSGSAAWLAFVIPGGVLLAIGWSGLPVWPLVLARLVFSKPPSHKSYADGTS
jgi:hypothetical protein